MKRTDEGDPASLLLGRVRTAILRVLFMSPAAALHLRAIARQTGFAVASVQREVRLLESVGLLLRSEGSLHVSYTANTVSPLFESMRDLLRVTIDPLQLIRTSLAPLAEQISVAFTIQQATATDAEQAPTAAPASTSSLTLIVIGMTSFEAVLERLPPAESIPVMIELMVFSPAGYRALSRSASLPTRLSTGDRRFLVGDETFLRALTAGAR